MSAFLPSKTALRGNSVQAAAITFSLETPHPLHLADVLSVVEDHLLIDAISQMALHAAPDTSTSLPVRSIILSDPPLRHMAFTMQRMHSSEPGTGTNLQLRQSMTSASPWRSPRTVSSLLPIPSKSPIFLSMMASRREGR